MNKLMSCEKRAKRKGKLDHFSIIINTENSFIFQSRILHISHILTCDFEIPESQTLTEKLNTCAQAKESFHTPSQSNNAQIKEDFKGFG